MKQAISNQHALDNLHYQLIFTKIYKVKYPPLKPPEYSNTNKKFDLIGIFSYHPAIVAVIKAALFEKNSINVDLAFGFFAIFAESMPQPTTFSPNK